MTGIPLDRVISWLNEADQLVGDAVEIGAPSTGEIGKVCTDSRLAQPGSLFVAIEGERVDGHRFVDEANRNGAVAALVSHQKLAQLRKRLIGSITLLPVNDPLASLQYVARMWRLRFPNLIRIGVTGSNGKTTTKEMIASILGHVDSTVRSAGNFNSEIGLPMEILKIRDEHRIGVFEMGINRVGEMALLADLVDPTIGLVTNVGTAHIGMFGSRDALIDEKRALFSRFGDSQIAIVPDDSDSADRLVEGLTCRVVRYNQDTAGIDRIEPAGIDGLYLTIAGERIRLGIPGTQTVHNAIAAVTTARLAGAGDAEVAEGLASVAAVPGRCEVIAGPITVIHDAYNANPESVVASFDFLAEFEAGGRKIAVIGSMKELGEFSDDAHRSVHAYAVRQGFDQVWLIGREFAQAVRKPGDNVFVFDDDQWDEVERRAADFREGDTILLKGSRDMALERLLPAIRGGAA